MKKVIAVGVLFGMFALTACEKKEDTSTEEPVTETPSGNVTVDNNEVSADGEKGSLNEYYAQYPVDANSNKPFLDIFAYADMGTDSYMAFHIAMHDVPTESKTLEWQSGDNAPGNIAADEFIADVTVNKASWYGGFTSDGYGVTGTLEVIVSGDEITFALPEIQLGNDLLDHKITERVNCSAQITLKLSELQQAVADGSFSGDLIENE